LRIVVFYIFKQNAQNKAKKKAVSFEQKNLPVIFYAKPPGGT